ncbi:hypothetical protein N7G274_010513 [Stereocaulon virgatum]|uniref:Uncharacterized protein n=1 Tax=Stereocaulon virgatum TaxID=373712 RepID=A0ABR3ZUI0_9LECA
MSYLKLVDGYKSCFCSNVVSHKSERRWDEDSKTGKPRGLATRGTSLEFLTRPMVSVTPSVCLTGTKSLASNSDLPYPDPDPRTYTETPLNARHSDQLPLHAYTCLSISVGL